MKEDNEQIHGLMPHREDRYPRSRDWDLPNFSCKRRNCVANVGGHCMTPSKCEIDENGKCSGYKSKENPLRG